MKYIFFLIATTCSFVANCQYYHSGYNLINSNPRFLHTASLPHANDFSYPCCGSPTPNCWTFQTPLTNPGAPRTRPGLEISHGTPNFTYYGDAGCLYMEDDARPDINLGHGILIEAKFEAHEEYVISFALCCDHPQGALTNLSNGYLRFAIPDGRPFNRTFAHCGDQIPSGVTLLASRDFTGTFNRFFQQFTLTPTGNSDYLWIYPKNVIWGTGLTSAALEYVAIQKKCSTGPCINLVDNPIPAKNYTNLCINAGSWNNGYSPLTTTIDPTSNTSFHASSYVSIVENFVANPGAGGSFVAEIRPTACDILDCATFYGTPGHPTIVQQCNGERNRCTDVGLGSKPGRQENNAENIGQNSAIQNSLSSSASALTITENQEKFSKFIIHPNPTTGTFTVHAPKRKNYTIRVMNILGTTVYEEKIEYEDNMTIQLDNSLPSGNYTIYINGEGIRHVEKLVLSK